MIPAIAPNQDISCALCGTKSSVMPNLEAHHMIPRSLGGTETITLCVPCHEATEHPDPRRRLVVGRTDDYVFALLGGKPVVKRWFPPDGFDEGLFVQQLEAAPENLKRASFQFKYLTDAALEAAASAMKDIMGVSWYCLANLFREAALRQPWGDKQARLLAFAGQFDLRKSQAYKYIEALSIAEEHDLVHKMDSWSPDALLLLKTAGDVGKAIERYETLADSGPYTLAQFRADLRADNTDPLAPPPDWCRAPCAECGTVHPHIKGGSR